MAWGMISFRRAVLLTAFVIVTAVATDCPSAIAQEQGQGTDPDSIERPRWVPHAGVPSPYNRVGDWGRLPGDTVGRGQSIKPDSHGNMWALTLPTRPEQPTIVMFDRAGKYVKGFGAGMIMFPHALYIDKEDNVWVVDSGIKDGKGNQVIKFSPDGKVLLRLGKAGVLATGELDNFMGPAGVAVADNGDIFVTDGHTTSPDGGGRFYSGRFEYWKPEARDLAYVRVVRFSKDGKFIKAWGKQGDGPGELSRPHNVAIDSQGRVFIADRGNARVQIFDQDGKFLDSWYQFGYAHNLFIDAHDTLYVQDNESNQNLWSYRYSTLGKDGCYDGCTQRVQRLASGGVPSQDFNCSIRIGSVRDGVVTAQIPCETGPDEAVGPINVREGLGVDAEGSVYIIGGRGARDFISKYVKKVELPEGPGKLLVQKACTSCHDFEQFPRVNFDRKDWELTVNTMVAGGAALRAEEIPLVIDYLATNFKGQGPSGVALPGNVKAAIKEWQLPTPNSLPYKITNTMGNEVAYTARFANVIGKFDPKSERFKEYPLRRGTDPVSLVEFSTYNMLGVIFFASQGESMIGEFHVMDGFKGYWREGDVFVHPTPGGKGRLQDIAVGRTIGNVWFTMTEAQPPRYPQGSVIGNYNKLTTEMRLAEVPTPNAGPYAIAVNSKSFPFFTMRNNRKLGSVHPLTMQITEHVLPNSDSRPTDLTITPDDAVWYTDSSRGYLGRYDAGSGKFSEWASPSGPNSLPGGITSVGNTLWYIETATKPNMLVRFDPKTQKFQSWEMGGTGGARNLRADKDGTLWFTRPLGNRIGRVTIEE